MCEKCIRGRVNKNALEMQKIEAAEKKKNMALRSNFICRLEKYKQRWNRMKKYSGRDDKMPLSYYTSFCHCRFRFFNIIRTHLMMRWTQLT
jgi:hypothetical protein